MIIRYRTGGNSEQISSSANWNIPLDPYTTLVPVQTPQARKLPTDRIQHSGRSANLNPANPGLAPMCFQMPMQAPLPWVNPAYYNGQVPITNFGPSQGTMNPTFFLGAQNQWMPCQPGQSYVYPSINQGSGNINAWLSRVKLDRNNNNLRTNALSDIKYKDKTTSGPKKERFFRFCWWNGGGKIRSRLRTNPVLRKLLAKKFDIFTYGEAETPSPHDLGIDGYICFLHTSKIGLAGNYRRGLAVFYLERYRYLVTRVYASRVFDIVWLKLVLGGDDLYFCFFYAPGSHHPLPARKSFYDEFSREFERFASRGKVFLVGDTNARLGSFLDDKNLNGKTISNPNKPQTTFHGIFAVLWPGRAELPVQ